MPDINLTPDELNVLRALCGSQPMTFTARVILDKIIDAHPPRFEFGDRIAWETNPGVPHDRRREGRYIMGTDVMWALCDTIGGAPCEPSVCQFNAQFHTVTRETSR